MRNRIICDASSLITLSENCMLPLIVELSEKTDFIITRSVYDEIITNPWKGGRHRMGPLKFGALVNNEILQVEKADKSETNKILELSNSIYKAKGKWLRIIQEGEAEALALANDGDVLLMDERTLRFLIENPCDLVDLLKYRIHKGVSMDKKRAKDFKRYSEGVGVIRSSEIVAVAYEMGILEKYFSGERRKMLEATLWSLKNKGCSLSRDDITEYMEMLKSSIPPVYLTGG